jgi:xanthine dehydrogenase YagR molybdenum-binding subunit
MPAGNGFCTLARTGRAAVPAPGRGRSGGAVLHDDERGGGDRDREERGRGAQHGRGDVASALAAPGLVKIEQTYVVPVETNNPMEPSATVAEWEGDRLTPDKLL